MSIHLKINPKKFRANQIFEIFGSLGFHIVLTKDQNVLISLELTSQELQNFYIDNFDNFDIHNFDTHLGQITTCDSF